MRRIAFLRSIEVQQTDPYLRELGAVARERGLELRLFFTDGECGPDDFPGTSERLPVGCTPAQVVERVLAWGADGVISLSIPDENALRDAIVRDLLAEHLVPMVMHGTGATSTLANKWETKQALRAFGLSTPPGLLVDGDLLNDRNVAVPAYRDFFRTSARVLGYPLLTKPLWDCLGTGIRFLADDRAVTEYLDSPYDGNTVLERCLTGELCSVEIVGTGTDLAAQPLVWKGPTGEAPSFVFEQVRYAAPRPEADARFAPVLDKLLAFCAGLGLNGSVEVEMIYSDSDYHVIEINPRVSGSTTLSVAASGDNTYAGLLGLLLGDWADLVGEFGTRRRLAYQIPVCPIGPDLLAELEDRLDLVRASSFHIDGRSYANAVLTCPFDATEALAAELRVLTEQYGLLTPGVLAEMERLLASVTDRTAVAA